MKLETLAKRLAKNTGCPALEQVILGQADIHALPMECMPWTGRTQAKPGVVIKKCRDRSGMVYPSAVIVKPTGIVEFDGKRHPAHRLIFSLMTKPTYEFRMTQRCGTPLCVNPLHWDVQEIEGSSPPPPPPAVVIPDIPEEEPWSLTEAEGLVETYLTTHEPRGWDELIVSDLLMDIPHDLLREVLIKLRRTHLL